MNLSSRHRKTYDAIFEEPTRADVEWDDIEKLFRHMGGDVKPGKGSRRRVALNGSRQVFHRPHPEKETDKGALESVRAFIERAGMGPAKEGEEP